MSQSWSLKVQGLDDLSWASIPYSILRSKSKPNLYVQVYLDGVQVARTKIVKGSLSANWGETLTILSGSESSALVFELKHKSSIYSETCFGTITRTVGDLLRDCGEAEVTPIRLEHGNGRARHDAEGVMSVGIKRVNSSQARGDFMDTAQQDLEGRHIDHGVPDISVPQELNDLTATVSKNGDILVSLGTVLNKIQLIADATVNAVDTIAKIHPYADAAWKVLSSVYKAYKQQKQTDEAVIALFNQMAALYAFVDDVENLPSRIERFERTIVRVLEQTTECGIFFREYTDHGFIPRLLGQAISNRSQVISDLSAALGRLQTDLNSGVMLHTAFVSSQNHEAIGRLVMSDILKGLKPAEMNATSRPLCLPGTRQDLLKDIIDRLLTPSNDKNVVWLHGAAGLGKSTLATTVAEYFRGLQRRGAFLYFDRNIPIESHPDRVIRTLTYQLAEQNQAIRSSVSAAIDRDPQVVSAPLSTQFASLLSDPLADISAQAESTTITGPIIIVLDALDECGNADSRRALLNLLSQDFSKLPCQYRFLITSRPDPDIARAFASCKHVHAVDLGKASDADMLMYIRHEMKATYENRRISDELPLNWPGEHAIQRLAAYAAGLFIWAATAMKLLFTTDFPVEWLDSLLSQESPTFTLDELYKTALSSVVNWQSGKSADIYRRILGAIVISQVPLTDSDIGDLLGLDSSKCRIALRRLGSVIQWSEGQPARTLHKSFPDYLTDPERCSLEPWFAYPQQCHRALTVGCLRVMESRLRFNICHLETSHIFNSDVKDLPARIEACIPHSLSYACCFWTYHLSNMHPNDLQIMDLILAFFKRRFLYWLEILSLTQEVKNARRSLEMVHTYAKGLHDKVQTFSQDATNFVSVFAPAISASTPHIYVSCISFAPRSSILKQTYSRNLPNTFLVDIGLEKEWPACQQVILGHTQWVASVAYSPDGRRIASGSLDMTIRIWDAETGALVVGPLNGHTAHVTSVVYSPDGRHIASGSIDKTIRIWDTETGALVVGPLQGHTDYVTSVVYSPDGQRIASGSEDKTICIWDAETGALIVGPLHGHERYVTSVVYSPDGRRITSGSYDKTIHIWDAETGAVVIGPLQGHTGPVTSVVYSPDGRHIASGSWDKTIHIWDAKTGALIVGPLHGHTDYVTSVVYSPDGRHIASGSNDKTIRIWDAETGALVVGPLRGHGRYVTSVVYSPDGRRITSGSYDQTVRIWDTETGALDVGPLQGHTWPVTSVVYSPDGRHIASGSEDKTIHIWGAETGALVVGPLKGHTGPVSCVVYSPGGQHIASGSQDRTIRIWDAETGALVVGPLQGHTDWMTSVVYSPDGRRIASGSDVKTIRIWGAETGALVVGPLQGHKDYVTSVVYSPDGQCVISGSRDHTIRIWDAETGALVVGALQGHTDYVTSVVYSPDGRHIASGSNDKTIRIWDAETGILVVRPLQGHTGPVTSVVYLPDGQCIASGSYDKTIRIWDAKTGALIVGPLHGHTDYVTSVVYSPDGRHITSGSRDKTIRVWVVGDPSMQAQLVSSIQDSSLPCGPDQVRHPDGFTRDSRLVNGWMLNLLGEILCYIPPAYSTGLWWQDNTAVIARQSTRLDFTKFVHGEDWIQCYIRT